MLKGVSITPNRHPLWYPCSRLLGCLRSLLGVLKLPGRSGRLALELRLARPLGGRHSRAAWLGDQGPTLARRRS